jgi:hypothetical protein
MSVTVDQCDGCYGYETCVPVLCVSLLVVILCVCVRYRVCSRCDLGTNGLPARTRANAGGVEFLIHGWTVSGDRFHPKHLESAAPFVAPDPPTGVGSASGIRRVACRARIFEFWS